MSVTAAALATWVGAAPDDPLVASCLAEAQALVLPYAAGHTVPEDEAEEFGTVTDRAVKEVGGELYHRRSAPNGASQFADPNGTPFRVARDPMVAAYPLFKRWAAPFA